MRSARSSSAQGGSRGNDSQRHCGCHRDQGKRPAPVAERVGHGREDVQRVGGNTARICDDVVRPQSAKIATNRFNAIAHEAYDKLAYSNAEPN